MPTQETHPSRINHSRTRRNLPQEKARKLKLEFTTPPPAECEWCGHEMWWEPLGPPWPPDEEYIHYPFEGWCVDCQMEVVCDLYAIPWPPTYIENKQ